MNASTIVTALNQDHRDLLGRLCPGVSIRTGDLSATEFQAALYLAQRQCVRVGVYSGRVFLLPPMGHAVRAEVMKTQ